MSEFLDQIPENIQEHIKMITKSSGLPDTEESVEKIAESWLEKRNSFESKMEEMNMEEIEILEKDDERAAIAMTFSGSLVTIGSLGEAGRRIEYASIGLRQDVPELLTKDDCGLAGDVVVEKEIEFENGPIKKTSAIYKVIVCKEELEAEEQDEQIKKASTLIIEDFVQVNKTIIQ